MSEDTKLYFYVPKNKTWMKRWLKHAVKETDLGLTAAGKPRKRKTSAWLWALVEATLAERYYKVRRQLKKDGEEIPDLDAFMESEK